MNHPRFRVRTLLIATTIAAVVVACLAPWLRGMPTAGWLMLTVRAGLMILGAAMSVVVALTRYHYFLDRARSSLEAISAQCRGVHINPVMGIGLLVVTLPVLVLLDSLIPVLRFSNSPGASASENWMVMGVVASQYLMSGMVLASVCMRSLTNHTEVKLDRDRFISRGFTTRWKPGMRFRWIDRASGQMLLILPKVGQFELSIDEDKIEAAERLLTDHLPHWR